VSDGQRPAVFSIIGPPGAGKSTALLALAQQFPELARFGVRDYGLRLASAGDPLGLAMREPLLRQELLPDEQVLRGFARFMGELPPGARVVAVEGYPRNARQGADLLAGLRDRGCDLAGLVVIDIPDDLVRKRVANRRLCSACGKPVNDLAPSSCPDCGEAIARRLDDEDAALERRLADYREVSRWLRGFFADRGQHLVDGQRGADEVRSALAAVLRLGGDARPAQPEAMTGSKG
jgi:adenylate kinase